MSKHYTANTVSVSKWCKRCKAHTQHRVDDRRVGPCLGCIENLELQHRRHQAETPQDQQQFLFVSTSAR